MAKDKEKDGDDEEVKFVAVGDGAETPEEREESQRREPVRERSDVDDKDDDDDRGNRSEDRRLGAAEEGGEEEDERRKERRRQERRDRKIRQRDAQRRDQLELKFLRNRNESLEKKFSHLEERQDATEVAGIDAEIRRNRTLLRTADRALADAVTAQKGEDVAEATRLRDEIRDSITKLETRKERQELAAKARAEERDDGEEGEARAPKGEKRQSAPDPEVTSLIRDWHRRNSWYDFARGDEDSAIVGVIDAQVAEDGYDPADPEYYEELDRRIAKRLPHRAEDDDDGRSSRRERGSERDDGKRSRRSPDETRDIKRPNAPRFRVGGQERQLRSNEVLVTPERRRAMEEAGLWDDEKLRNKMLKRYAEFDRSSASQRR